MRTGRRYLLSQSSITGTNSGYADGLSKVSPLSTLSPLKGDRAKEIGDQLSKLREQSAILAEIRQARPPYRPSIMNVFFNATVGCFAAAASVGLFWWTIRHLAPPQADSRGVMTILTRIAIVIAFSVGRHGLHREEQVSGCFQSRERF